MPDRNEQASAYLREADTTLRSASVLLEDDPDTFAPQVVKNAYDAFEQALSGGIAERGEDIPQRHGAKIQRFFDPLDADDLHETALGWHARRSEAQYVDIKGGDLSVPSSNFDREDAEQIVDDAERILAFVREQTGNED